MPVPLRSIVNGDGVPFVVSVMDPLTAVAVVGVKTALKFMLPPAAIVVEVVSPLIVIPVPDTAMFENESVAFPLFFSVIGCELLLPTFTLLNATLDGEAEICACVAVPVPLRLIAN